MRLGDRSAEEIAESILRGHVDDNARAMAAVALGRARDPRVTGVLRESIGDRNIDVRIGAAVALAHYGHPAGVEYLKAAMRDDGYRRRGCMSANSWTRWSFRTRAKFWWRRSLRPTPNCRCWGFGRSACQGGPTKSACSSGWRTSSNLIARAEVAWALGRIGSRGSVAPLIAMVSELDHTVRYTAADALDRTAMRLLQGESPGGA